jgi:tRNA pseudouridine65 synthase
MDHLEILFQDDCLVAVNKPSGLLVHASAWAGPERDSVAARLPSRLGRPVFPVHRLDRATSGLLVLGLSSENASALSRQFQEKLARKEYLAIVRGFAPERGKIDRALEKIESEDVQDALTEFERLATAELPVAVDRYPSTRFSLVRARPLTGRMHQIRRHLRGINHPVVGDSSYGDGAVNRVAREHLGSSRLLLHSRKLELAHPATGAPLRLEAPPTADFASVIERLGWQRAMET